jgi:sphingomyelin phosphodiesterase acid-like 3
MNCHRRIGGNIGSSSPRHLSALLVALAVLLGMAKVATGQTVSALLLSDVHFDPFQDPGKVGQLATAPVEQWEAILNAPASPDQDAEFTRVRAACGPLVLDTSALLLDSTLQAVREHAGQVLFATYTGDLIVHDFQCRFDAVLPGRPQAEERAFVLKTMLYVVRSLQSSLGGKPLYVALGNNDSLCGDYRLDPQDVLYRGLEDAVMSAAGVRSDKARRNFETFGSFSAVLPGPMRGTRIVVLDDLPYSSRFLSCAGVRAPQVARSQAVWLDQELEAARREKQTVWTVAHIPTGIDPRPTMFPGRGVASICTSRKPVVFQDTEALAGALTSHSDVVKLALFAHTHMDEVRLMRGEKGSVPAKMVPSVSPVGFNRPSLTVAEVNASTAEMQDYRAYAVEDWTVKGAKFVPAYRFRETYSVGAFSIATIDGLTKSLEGDATGKSDAAQKYIRSYTSGGFSPYGIESKWPVYRCMLRHGDVNGFLQCACPLTEVH